MRIRLSLKRYRPGTDLESSWKDYYLEIRSDLTVLETLIQLKEEEDGSLAFRYSCGSAICGSCAMRVNGVEKVACQTAVRDELERVGALRVEPLGNTPVIKDLVTDNSPFWGKVRQVTPWLHFKTSGDAPSSGAAFGREQFEAFHNVEACILCGACASACNSLEVSSGFTGPAALAKAYRFVVDPRETAAEKEGRLRELTGADGIWDCVRCNFCVEVCPKDVKPMEAIILLRRASIQSDLTQTMGSRHITGFVDIIRREGRLNEGLMPMKVIGFRIKDFLRILPLGIKMFLKGKVPFPFRLRPAIPGMKQVRAIFDGRKKK